MKTIKVLFVVACAISISTLAKAQNYKLDAPFLTAKTIKVNGTCEMCKQRIENALRKSASVSSANWDVNSKIVQLVYYKGQTNLDKIQALIAAAGHDTEKFKAPDNVYEKLPDCCKYPRTN